MKGAIAETEKDYPKLHVGMSFDAENRVKTKTGVEFHLSYKEFYSFIFDPFSPSDVEFVCIATDNEVRELITRRRIGRGYVEMFSDILDTTTMGKKVSEEEFEREMVLLFCKIYNLAYEAHKMHIGKGVISTEFLVTAGKQLEYRDLIEEAGETFERVLKGIQFNRFKGIRLSNSMEFMPLTSTSDI